MRKKISFFAPLLPGKHGGAQLRFFCDDIIQAHLHLVFSKAFSFYTVTLESASVFSIVTLTEVISTDFSVESSSLDP